MWKLDHMNIEFFAGRLFVNTIFTIGNTLFSATTFLKVSSKEHWALSFARQSFKTPTLA